MELQADMDAHSLWLAIRRYIEHVEKAPRRASGATGRYLTWRLRQRRPEVYRETLQRLRGGISESQREVEYLQRVRDYIEAAELRAAREAHRFGSVAEILQAGAMPPLHDIVQTRLETCRAQARAIRH